MWRNWKPAVTMPRVDLPEFTRCCFCLPLRHGLMVWGYLKMILLSIIAYLIIKDIIRWGAHPVAVVIIILVTTDIAFNILVIVAGHLKHQRLFMVYYYYSIVVLWVYFVFLIWFFCWNWYGYLYFSMGMVLRVTLDLLTTFIPVIFIQGYVTLMVRTEARKLANNSNFEYVNHTQEATCSMDPEVANNVATATP